LIALIELEKLVRTSNQPQVLAWLGFCLAKEKRDFSRALVLCTSAVDTAPDDADLYLALGRTCRLSGRRYQALSALRKGLKMGRHELIVKELNAMGLRKEPVFGALDRANRLNVMAGRVMTRFNFR
jgi:tetratricopeptide (TPR) repeat protein